jgi:polyisoprenoid-binding protein YceI
MHLMLALLVAVAQQPSPSLSLQEYAVDAGHSIVEFSVGFALARVKGRFPDTHGTILYDPAHPERSSVSVVLETKSIDTGWPHRDEHLRTDDFFDVEKYPTITFQSRTVRPARDGWVMTGPLTIHGVTRDVAIPFRFLAPPSRNAESHWMILNAVGALRLARRDFGILGGDRHNSWFTAARNATVSDSVDVSLEIEGYLPDAESQRSPRVLDAATRARTQGAEAIIKQLAAARGTRSDAEFAPYFTGGDMVVRALLADGYITEGVTLSRGLTGLFPQLSNAYLLYGFALSAAGDTAGATKQYARARDVFRPPVEDPTVKFKQVDDTWYYNDQRVRAALEWGRISEGLSLARVLVDLYPTTARAHVTFGLARALAGDTAGARTSYKRALELDPTETRAIEWMRRLAR